MANLCLNTQFNDSQRLNQDPSDDEDPETPEEEMPQPWCYHLPECQPKITTIAFRDALEEDRKVLEDLQRSSEILSAKLQRTAVQSQVLQLLRQIDLCAHQRASEDFWLSFVVEPTLKLARELSGRQDTVLALPLKTVTVSPSSLLPRWKGTIVSRKVDWGLVTKLDDDINHRIQNLPDQEDGEGIGPASTEFLLQTHPLFCHIEVKKQHQVVDPIIQLGVWTSAVYTCWEQVKALHGSSRDLPISFGWTIEGRNWNLHLIRRLPNGSRQITENAQLYDAKSPSGIYLVIATLCQLIEYGHEEFREQFLDSVLSIRSQYPAGSGTPNMRFGNSWRWLLFLLLLLLLILLSMFSSL